MNCECGKEMKDINEEYGTAYCATTYYCDACDVFSKDEIIKVARIRKIDEMNEIEDCRDLLNEDE
jgi:hypothetical protein